MSPNNGGGFTLTCSQLQVKDKYVILLLHQLIP
jgi:hypothetical protein